MHTDALLQLLPRSHRAVVRGVDYPCDTMSASTGTVAAMDVSKSRASPIALPPAGVVEHVAADTASSNPLA